MKQIVFYDYYQNIYTSHIFAVERFLLWSCSVLFCLYEIILILKDTTNTKTSHMHRKFRCLLLLLLVNLLGELHLDVQLAGVLRQLDVHIKEHVVDVMHSHLVQQQMVLTLYVNICNRKNKTKVKKIPLVFGWINIFIL